MKTLQLFHNEDLVIDASTICSLRPFAITGKICLKSPPTTTVLPPKGLSALLLAVKCKISLSERSTASKQF